MFGLLVLTPMVAFGALTGLKELIKDIGDVINLLRPVIYGLAMIYFFWGLADFILKAGDEKAREAGKSRMLWGIIALFVFVSIMGILGWISGVTDIPTNVNSVNTPGGFTAPLNPRGGDSSSASSPRTGQWIVDMN